MSAHKWFDHLQTQPVAAASLQPSAKKCTSELVGMLRHKLTGSGRTNRSHNRDKSSSTCNSDTSAPCPVCRALNTVHPASHGAVEHGSADDCLQTAAWRRTSVPWSTCATHMSHCTRINTASRHESLTSPSARVHCSHNP
jgi:hypothetical protein